MGLVWSEITGATAALPNRGYFVNSATQVAVTLPSSGLVVGDTIRLVGVGSGGWRLSQNASQSIWVGSTSNPIETWTNRVPPGGPSSIAMSSDGSVILAGKGPVAFLQVSTDSGGTWTARDAARAWGCVATSSDGVKMVAGVGEAGMTAGFLYTSIDSGTSWTQRATSLQWLSVASSSNGTKLVAAADAGFGAGEKLYTSIDSGVTWTARDSNRNWRAVASSSDGVKLVAGIGGMAPGNVYTSTDSGVTWVDRGAPMGATQVHRLVSSSDGTKLAALSNNALALSTDSGVTWTLGTVPTASSMYGLAGSSDGAKLLITGNAADNYVFATVDNAQTWSKHAPLKPWYAVACSSDCGKVTATTGSQLYTTAAFLGEATTVGVGGALFGIAGTSAEVVYMGSNNFRLVSSVGALKHQ
jgi:hypothetical protein